MTRVLQRPRAKHMKQKPANWAHGKSRDIFDGAGFCSSSSSTQRACLLQSQHHKGTRTRKLPLLQTPTTLQQYGSWKFVSRLSELLLPPRLSVFQVLTAATRGRLDDISSPTVSGSPAQCENRLLSARLDEEIMLFP